MTTLERGDRRVTMGYCQIAVIDVLNALLMRLDRLGDRA